MTITRRRSIIHSSEPPLQLRPTRCEMTTWGHVVEYITDLHLCQKQKQLDLFFYWQKMKFKHIGKKKKNMFDLLDSMPFYWAKTGLQNKIFLCTLLYNNSINSRSVSAYCAVCLIYFKCNTIANTLGTQGFCTHVAYMVTWTSNLQIVAFSHPHSTLTETLPDLA